MKQDKGYSCRTEFNDDSIRLMFKTEYFTYEKKLLAGRIGFAVVLLLVCMFAGLPLPARALCLLVGVWLLVALDFPSKIRAEGVIQRRNGASSQVNIVFSARDIQAEQQPRIAYAELERLVEEKDYFILFKNRQNAVMVEKAGLSPQEPDAFRSFIEQKTGKHFTKNINILSMNLFDLLDVFTGGKTAKRRSRKKR